MEAPNQLAGARIEGPHVAIGALRIRIGNDGSADHDVFIDGGRRGHAVAAPEAAFVGGVQHAGAQVNQSALAEGVDGLAGGRVDGPKLAVQRSIEQTLLLAVGPKCGAPAGEQHLGLGLVELWIEGP